MICSRPFGAGVPSPRTASFSERDTCRIPKTTTPQYRMGLILQTTILFFIASNIFAQELHQQESARTLWAKAELAEARQSLANTTNKTERVFYEDRIHLAEKALKNQGILAKLDKKEKSLLQERHRSPDFVLRKTLSVISTDETAAKESSSQHNIEIRKLKEEREEEQKKLSSITASSGFSVAAQQRADARLTNMDAKIMTHVLARDTEEYKLHLMKEAIRIDNSFNTVDQNVRITIRILLDAYRTIKQTGKRLEESQSIQDELQAQSSDIGTVMALSHRHIKGLEQELKILKDRAQVEKDGGGATGDAKNKVGIFGKMFGSGTKAKHQIERMIKDIEAETILINEQIDHLTKQRANIYNSLDLIKQYRDLIEAELSYITAQTAKIRKQYIQRIMLPIITITFLFVFYFIISHLIFPFTLKQDSIFIARRLGGYIVFMLIFVVIITFFLEDLKAIATIMGIVGAAIVIALQDMCSAFAGWFVIISSRKIRVGDRVEINGHRGEVIDIQMLRTTLLELNNWLEVDETTGRMLIIPNNFIFKSEVFNYSHIHPYIWGKVDITVTFESDPKKTYDLLFEALKDVTANAYAAAAKGGKLMVKHYGVTRGIYEPHIHTFIGDSGVCYSLFYVANYRKFTTMRDKIMIRVIEEVNKTKYTEFAYPTERHIPTPIT